MVSKKASKKFNKAKSKVSAKAKQKAKLTEKIKRRDEIKESKRKAKLTEAEVEAGQEDMDAELDAQLAEMGSDDEAVFCVPDGMDGEEELVKALNDGEDDEEKTPTEDGANDDEAAAHKKELEALKETDPEFYKFLQETDQDLLEFGHGEETVEESSEKEESKPKAKVLTMDRLNQLTEAAEGKKDGNKSLKALRAVLSAYRVASRMSKGEAKEGGASEEGEESAAAGVRIEDATVFNAVLEWTLKNAPELLDHHDKQVAKSKGKQAGAGGGGKTYMLGRMFWSESLNLLQQLTDLDTQKFVLWQLANESALKYLMPLKKLKPLVINELCRKWAKGAAQGTKLAAFSVLYNLVGHILKSGASSKKSAEVGREVEGIMRRMYRA